MGTSCSFQSKSFPKKALALSTSVVFNSTCTKAFGIVCSSVITMTEQKGQNRHASGKYSMTSGLKTTPEFPRVCRVCRCHGLPRDRKHTSSTRFPATRYKEPSDPEIRADLPGNCGSL